MRVPNKFMKSKWDFVYVKYIKFSHRQAHKKKYARDEILINVNSLNATINQVNCLLCLYRGSKFSSHKGSLSARKSTHIRYTHVLYPSLIYFAPSDFFACYWYIPIYKYVCNAHFTRFSCFLRGDIIISRLGEKIV